MASADTQSGMSVRCSGRYVAEADGRERCRLIAWTQHVANLGLLHDGGGMTPTEPQSRTDLVVELDYHHFNLCGTRADIEDGGTLPDLLGQAWDNDGIAQSGTSVTVIAPYQWDFEAPLQVEVWPGEPEDDLDAWDEAFEAHLRIDDDGLSWLSPIDGYADIDVAAGSYHVAISARPIDSPETEVDDEPKWQWRLRLWPSNGPEVARRLRGATAIEP